MAVNINVYQLKVSASGAGGNYGPDLATDPGLIAKLSDVQTTITNGLKAEADRITAAQANGIFYRLENKVYLAKREAETASDFDNRPKRTSGLLRASVGKLAAKLYQPGPSRTFITEAEIEADDNATDVDDLDDEESQGKIAQWLANAYEKANVNTVFDAANRRAILNDVCAIQVVCTGNEAKPIRFYTFDGSEFAAFVTEDEPTVPWAVVLISLETDSHDQKRRVFKLWTDTQVLTYATKWIKKTDTSGGIVSKLIKTEANPYGVLPFVFFHNETPVDRFWGSGIGDALRDANAEVDRTLSDLAQLEQVFLCPDMFARNLPPAWRYQKIPGRPQMLPSLSQSLEGDATLEADVFYRQPEIAIEQTWFGIEKYVNQTLFELNVPLNYSRETNAPTSGIQVIAESAPFLDYLKTRVLVANAAEQDLVKVTLACAAVFYQEPAFALASEDIKVDLVWPEPSLPVPTPEADATDQWELSFGLASPVQVIMRRRGVTRRQAIQILKQIKEDNDLYKQLFPNETPGVPAAAPVAAKPDNPFLSGGDSTDNEAPTDGQETDPAEAESQDE